MVAEGPQAEKGSRMTESTAEHLHPMRDAEILVYEKTEGEAGAQFIALLHRGKQYPIFFHHSTKEGAIKAADDFRNEAVTKHEAEYKRRKEASEKAKAAKAKKEAAA